jgi:hypothetical protein
MTEKQLTQEQKNEKRLAACKGCGEVTYKAGMCVCRKTGKRSIEMHGCPLKGW